VRFEKKVIDHCFLSQRTSRMKKALLRDPKNFIPELGKGFAFVERQKRGNGLRVKVCEAVLGGFNA
jgi:predicted nuclease of restriction endonuclease-like (RecB) superfamily